MSIDAGAARPFRNRAAIAIPLVLLLCAAGGGSAPASPAAPAPAQLQAVAVQQAFRVVAKSVKPAVVSIDSVFMKSEDDTPYIFDDPEGFLRHFFGEDQDEPSGKRPAPKLRRVMGIGSGVITDPRGYVLTNEHVVGGAQEISVIVKDPAEKAYKGKIVGTDPSTDLAVVKIEPKDGPFPYAVLGDSDKVQIGDWAIAVGSPFGLDQTVTVGVISALRQSMRVEEREYSDFFQTDAAINQGNSGGPLLDIQGQVIGVNTAIFSPTGVFGGIGFAIPSNQAARIMRELIANGRVIRGWLGVEIVPFDDALARQFNIPNRAGALVNSVFPASPADKAGVRRGDAIVGFDGRAIPSPDALAKSIEGAAPGRKVALRLIREGRALDLEIKVAERPVEPVVAAARAPSKPEGDGASLWEGAHLQTAEDGLDERFRLPRGAAGAVVTGVDGESGAEALGLQKGDLIQAINGRRVRDAASFSDAARSASLEDGVVLDVVRGGKSIYLSFRRPR